MNLATDLDRPGASLGLFARATEPDAARSAA
jgi:hypothetical protein